MSIRVRDIEDAIAERFPPERAEGWDQVGLLVGDASAEVRGVAFALDPTVSAIHTAAEAGANVLVTHHPAFLESPATVCAGPAGGGAAAFAAASRGVALINAHTNLDRDAAAQLLIPERLGLDPVRALETAPMPTAVVTVYVPPEDAEPVRAAMIAAGAGRIGDYRGCSFSAPGEGAFTPAEDSRPAIGEPGKASSAAEIRLEMVCPPPRARAVVAAAVAAHPYEEPLVTVAETQRARNTAALGMLARASVGAGAAAAGAAGVAAGAGADARVTLGTLARRAGERYGVTPRVWGDPGALVDLVATATGSAGSLIGEALVAGASALIGGEVRYHDALDAAERGLAVIELGHDVTEWPLVGLLEETVRAMLGTDGDATTGVVLHVLSDRPRWWTPADA